ncbi:hypothetical protein H6F44_21165 [Pseudanabaena sp. FACHB-1277]|uniref:Uncharacterized protein n=1 Tax=Pseudanabaena cinerea FACHB-1277 TaxID=2949581 RepID=A0A926UX21_9CYAN|nr:hypothetical protein [Pseudanabaena cinerea]MBD2152609.1 hypothetical protein [Pseudanabaena cinerea FACHB-1277]
MIKTIFTALTGITEDIDSDEYQSAWERRRYADENDLDDDDDDSDRDDDDDDTPKRWWQI